MSARSCRMLTPISSCMLMSKEGETGTRRFLILQI